MAGRRARRWVFPRGVAVRSMKMPLQMLVRTDRRDTPNPARLSIDQQALALGQNRVMTWPTPRQPFEGPRRSRPAAAFSEWTCASRALACDLGTAARAVNWRSPVRHFPAAGGQLHGRPNRRADPGCPVPRRPRSTDPTVRGAGGVLIPRGAADTDVAQGHLQ